MKQLLFLFLFIPFYYCYAQLTANDSLFSHAITLNYSKYKNESDLAFANRDFKKGKVLFKNFITNHLTQTYLDNFKVNFLNGSAKSFQKSFKKGKVIITNASWCIESNNDTKVINHIANQYSNNVDVILLLWDNQDDAKKVAKRYNKAVDVVYIDEKENTFSHEVKALKHTLGFPTVIFTNKSNKIAAIERPIISSNDENRHEELVSFYTNHIETLILTSNSIDNSFIAKD